MENFFDADKLVGIGFEHALERNAGPDGDDRRDVFFVHGFLKEPVRSGGLLPVSPCRALRRTAKIFLFEHLKIFFRLRKFAVSDLRNALKVAAPLGHFRFALQVINFLAELVQCFEFDLFRMPFARKLVVLLLQVREAAFRSP